MSLDTEGAQRRPHAWVVSCVAASIHLLILLTAVMAMTPSEMSVLVRSSYAGTITILWLAYVCGATAAGGLAALNSQGRALTDKTASNRAAALFIALFLPRSLRLRAALGLLLAIEGMLLLAPIFAAAPVATALNSGAVRAALNGEARVSDSNPFATAFDFGAYLATGFTKEDGLETAEPTLTEEYQGGCEPACAVDVFLPEALRPEAGWPALVHFHGGAWVGGFKSGSFTNFRFWLDRGFAIASVGYQFALDGKTLLDTVAAAEAGWAHVQARANAWGIDSSHAVLFGESAGGHLATVVAYRSAAPVAGVLNLYGPVELAKYIHRQQANDEPISDLVLDVLPDLSQARSVSAAPYISRSSPPTVTVQGTWDSIVPTQAQRDLHAALDAAGVPNYLLEIDTYEHGLDLGWRSVGGQLTRFAFAELIGAVMY